jgi:hypothetical protein
MSLTCSAVNSAAYLLPLSLAGGGFECLQRLLERIALRQAGRRRRKRCERGVAAAGGGLPGGMGENAVCTSYPFSILLGERDKNGVCTSYPYWWTGEKMCFKILNLPILT